MSLDRVQSRGRWRCRPVRFQKAQTWCWPDMAGTAQNGSKFEVVMVREKVIFGQRLWYHLFTISLCAILFCNSDMFGSYCAILFGWLPDHHGSTMIISIPNGLCTPLPKTFFFSTVLRSSGISIPNVPTKIHTLKIREHRMTRDWISPTFSSKLSVWLPFYACSSLVLAS